MYKKLKIFSLLLCGVLILQLINGVGDNFVVKAATGSTFTQNTAYPPSIGDTYVNQTDGLTYTVSNVTSKKVSGSVGIEYGFNYYCDYVDTANIMVPNPNPQTPFDLNNNNTWPIREDTTKANWHYDGYNGAVSMPAPNFGFKGSNGIDNFKNFWNVATKATIPNNGSDTARKDGIAPPVHDNSIVQVNMPHPDANMAYYVDENNIQYPVTMSSITTSQKSFGIYIANPLNGYTPPHYQPLPQDCQVWADDYFVTLTATVYTVTYTYSQQATVTVKYVDQSTNADIATPDTYTNVSDGSHTYSAKTIAGYTLQGNNTQTINVQSGQSYVLTFYYSKDPTSAGVTVNFLDSTTKQPIDSPYVYPNETPGSHSYYAKTIAGYNCVGSDVNGGTRTNATSQALSVVAGQSYVINFYYDVSKLPTVKLTAPSTAISGDLVPLMAIGKTSDPSATSLQVSIYIDGYPTERIDGDTVTFDAASTDKRAKTEGNGIFNPGTVKVHAYVYDNFGNFAEDEATIQVVLPTPVVVLNQLGVLKENRKFIVDASSSWSGGQNATINWGTAQWTITPLNGASLSDVRVQTHTNGSINGTVLYDPSKGITSPITGVKLIDIQVKKAGMYKVQCSLTNNYNMTGTNEATYTIIVDNPPLAQISVQPKVYRDPTNLNIATLPAMDESISNDDSIGQRIWFYAFDSNNNGRYDDETWNVNINGSWQPCGSYNDVINLINNPTKISSLNSGNLTNVNIQSTHVGKYDFEIVVKEEFGQEYIPQFTSESDKKMSNTFSH